MNGDRATGLVAVGAALAVTVEASTFTVGFYTDPLGARGLPFIAAALIGVGGLLLAVRPRIGVQWPPHPVLVKGLLVSTGLIIYAIALPFIGFLLATTAVITGSSVVFGGPVGRSAMLAGAYTLVLFALFVWVLGLPLPVGTIFVRGA